MLAARTRIQGIDRDLDSDAAGMTLAHEHVYAAFGAPSGDGDLDLTCEDAISADLTAASARGVSTIVEVSTEDMGTDVERIAALARAAGIFVVKSTGWFRSPTADPFVADQPVAKLTGRLVANLEGGFPSTRNRAGCLGEIGVSGSSPTSTEMRILDATAGAAVQTGAGVVLHTDDAENAQVLVDSLLRRDVPADRLQVGHARVADPIAWHMQLIERGCLLAFDQVGHPARDSVEAVADRVLALIDRGAERQIVLSSDVGRRSRLSAFGGDGYVTALHRLLTRLRDRGVAHEAITRLAGGTVARFLAMPDVSR